ncbi:MAG: hypothetical protein H6618_08905 [Deltaproteobacteria bacterium]|nr:hypothetical protein [Deltaproteobacteria bacterium]
MKQMIRICVSFRLYLLPFLWGMIGLPEARPESMAAPWTLELAPLQGLWGHPYLLTSLPIYGPFGLGLAYQQHKWGELPDSQYGEKSRHTEYQAEALWHCFRTGPLSVTVGTGLWLRIQELRRNTGPWLSRYGERKNGLAYRESHRLLGGHQALMLRVDITPVWMIGLRAELDELIYHTSQQKVSLSEGDAPGYDIFPAPFRAEQGLPELRLYTGLILR